MILWQFTCAWILKWLPLLLHWNCLQLHYIILYTCWLTINSTLACGCLSRWMLVDRSAMEARLTSPLLVLRLTAHYCLVCQHMYSISMLKSDEPHFLCTHVYRSHFSLLRADLIVFRGLCDAYCLPCFASLMINSFPQPLKEIVLPDRSETTLWMIQQVSTSIMTSISQCHFSVSSSTLTIPIPGQFTK